MNVPIASWSSLARCPRSKLVRYKEPSLVPLPRAVTRPEPLEIDGEPEFEVEKVLAVKGSV